VDWIELAQVKFQAWTLMNTEVNLRERRRFLEELND
jgi:hypothetical protein